MVRQVYDPWACLRKACLGSPRPGSDPEWAYRGTYLRGGPARVSWGKPSHHTNVLSICEALTWNFRSRVSFMSKKITNGQDLQFSRTLPAPDNDRGSQGACTGMVPPKNHSFCSSRAWVCVSRNSEGSQAWEAGLGCITCKQQPGRALRPRRPTTVAWIRAGCWPPQRLVCTPALALKALSL